MRERGSGTVFARLARRLRVRFHTSSVEKFLQARVIFRRRGLGLDYFRESQEPYQEEYGRGSRFLLQRALEEIRDRLGAHSLFFVEDTSVKIDALSHGDTVVPGLRIKEWFRRTNFEELDRELKRRGNDRAATVCSDIGLYVPELERPIFFHGETVGHVSEVLPTFEMSYQFPWLTPRTFNGWFVPRDGGKTLGEMGFEESLGHDFRVKSLTTLLDRLEEYSAIANLPANTWTVRRTREYEQKWLFRRITGREPLILVIGRMCAGKTTFGARLAERYGWLHVEASIEMRRCAREERIVDSEDGFDLAHELLRREGPDCVARSIAARYHDRLESGAVVSGFRAIEEVCYLRHRYPHCVVVLVEAGDRVRFLRHLERGRLKNVRTRNDFGRHDTRQWAFGLLARVRDVVDVARDLADIRVRNEGTLRDYHRQIDGLLERLDRVDGDDGCWDVDLRDVPGVSRLTVEAARKRRIFRCLEALGDLDGPARCSEVRQRMQEEEGEGTAITARHVNWVLSRLPQLASRVQSGGTFRYEILPAGRAYVEAVRMPWSRTMIRNAVDVEREGT